MMFSLVIIDFFRQLQPAIKFALFLLVFSFGLWLLGLIISRNNKKLAGNRLLVQYLFFIVAFSVSMVPLSFLVIFLAVLSWFILNEVVSWGKHFFPQIFFNKALTFMLIALPLAELICLWSYDFYYIGIWLILMVAVTFIVFFCEKQDMFASLLCVTMMVLLTQSLNGLLYLRQAPLGAALCLFTVFLTNFSDIFAYIGGKLFGRHPLFIKVNPEKVSPNKTAEGSLFGLLACIGFAFLFNLMLGIGMNRTQVLVVSIGIGTTGQLAGFVASVVKRKVAIKDFSQLLGGHGGVIDRCDSLFFTIPTTLLMFKLFGYA